MPGSWKGDKETSPSPWPSPLQNEPMIDLLSLFTNSVAQNKDAAPIQQERKIQDAMIINGFVKKP